MRHIIYITVLLLLQACAYEPKRFTELPGEEIETDDLVITVKTEEIKPGTYDVMTSWLCNKVVCAGDIAEYSLEASQVAHNKATELCAGPATLVSKAGQMPCGYCAESVHIHRYACN